LNALLCRKSGSAEHEAIVVSIASQQQRKNQEIPLMNIMIQNLVGVTGCGLAWANEIHQDRSHFPASRRDPGRPVS
jgi:hypothetical protein